MYFSVHSSIIYNCQGKKAPKCPIDDWIKKMWYMHTMKYYSAMTKKKIFAICSNMNGLGGH